MKKRNLVGRAIRGMVVTVILTQSLFAREKSAKPEPWEIRKATEEFELMNLTKPIKVPELDGEPWRITNRKPDCGDLNTGRQNGCDFSIWQAADGTWQLVSCIRYTKEPGITRIFFRWEGKTITDTNWQEKGIFYKANTAVGESLGFLQAPHTLLIDGKYKMFYNSGGSTVYSQISDDGKNFKLHEVNGTHRVAKGCGRDVCLVDVNGLWHIYACGDSKGIVCKTSKDLINWSKPYFVAPGCESPFMVERHDAFYLFGAISNTPRGGVYYSKDPLDFGGGDSTKYMIHRFLPSTSKHKAIAIEIFFDGEQEYAAWFWMPNTEAGFKKGFSVAKLKWVYKTPEEILQWKIKYYNHYRFDSPVETQMNKYKQAKKIAEKKLEKELIAKSKTMDKDEYEKAMKDLKEKKSWKYWAQIEQPKWDKLLEEERVLLNKAANKWFEERK